MPQNWSRRAQRAILPAALVPLMTLAAADRAAWAQDTAVRANVVNFSTTASEELTQDWMSVTLHVQRDGTHASEVQAAVRQVLDAALTEARKAAQGQTGMTVRTTGFSVQPRYSNQGRIAGWQGSAQLVLEGTDSARIAQTVGKLNTLQVGHVQYGLSRELRERQQAQLTADAIRQFRERASQMAQAFGFKGYTLGEVSVSSTDPDMGHRPPLMAMRAKTMEMAADAPLPVEPGKSTLSVTVSGQVVLTP